MPVDTLDGLLGRQRTDLRGGHVELAREDAHDPCRMFNRGGLGGSRTVSRRSRTDALPERGAGHFELGAEDLAEPTGGHGLVVGMRNVRLETAPIVEHLVEEDVP